MSTELESSPDGKLLAMTREIDALKMELLEQKATNALAEDCFHEFRETQIKLLGKIFALEKAGDAMDLLLTGSMKPSKGVREAWANAKKLST